MGQFTNRFHSENINSNILKLYLLKQKLPQKPSQKQDQINTKSVLVVTIGLDCAKHVVILQDVSGVMMVFAEPVANGGKMANNLLTKQEIILTMRDQFNYFAAQINSII